MSRRDVGRTLLLALLGISALAPLVLLAALSLSDRWFFPALAPEAWTLERWGEFGLGGGRLRRAAVGSMLLGLGVAVVSAALSLLIGRVLARLSGWRRAAATAVAFLPVAAPPIALGVGLQYSFLRVGLGGSFLGVGLAHLIPALGYTSLFFLGVFSGYDERPEAEARTLGATPLQVLGWVTIPRLRRPLAEAAALGFLVSWAQVPLTLLVGQGAVPTLAVEVLGHVTAGQDALAATAGLVLAIPPVLLLGAVGVGVRRTAAVVG